VIFDNTSIHAVKKLKPYWDLLEEKRMQFYFLPTHSPELNRIELLWYKMKYEWLRFKLYTPDELEQAQQHRHIRGLRSAFDSNLSISALEQRVTLPGTLFGVVFFIFTIHPGHKQLVTQGQHHRAEKQTDDAAGRHAAQCAQ